MKKARHTLGFFHRINQLSLLTSAKNPYGFQ